MQTVSGVSASSRASEVEVLEPWWPATLAAEVFGTGVIGGLAAYPVAKGLMGLTPATYTVYIVPFLISTVAGSSWPASWCSRWRRAAP